MSGGSTQSPAGGLSIRIAANFTIEPIQDFLSYWMNTLGIRSEIHIAPYNQVFQQLLEGGLLRTNRGGINLVALDLEAWLPAEPMAEARPQLERAIADLLSVLRTTSAGGVGGAVLLFPLASRPGFEERASAVAAAKAAILAEITGVSGWAAMDLTDAVSLYSVSETRDLFTEELGDIPFTEEMYAAAGAAAARWIRSVCGKPRKVIALDCDQTLWQGIFGEGSMAVTPPYRRFQEVLLRLRDSGMLLTLASKNNESDVMEALESESSLLRAEHFAAWRINWQPKSENLEALSEELGLALNSFVFIDDSSYECMEVRNRCPEVLAIQLPSDPEAIPGFLDHLWILDRMGATEEDRNRAAMYQAERQRTELSKRGMTTEEFLASLKIEIQFAPASAADLARVAQLTHRTTQFNFTGVLHTEQSLAAYLTEDGAECWTVRVRDVFGDYGLVGALLFKVRAGVLRVEVFLMSCRALGRRVEHEVMDRLKRLAIERGAGQLVIPVRPTTRNRPALEFLSQLGDISADAQEPFECVLPTTGGGAEKRSAEAAASQTPSGSKPAAKLPVLTDEEETMVRIATDLQSAESIIAAIRSNKKSRPAEAGPLAPPRTPMEEALARIWSESLAMAPIGTTDDFFAFGGHSLMATRILARVRTEFGVELSLTDLFKMPTIAGMASEIVERSAVRS